MFGVDAMLHLIAGPVGGGKTSFLRRACAEWAAAGRPVAGFLAERIGEPGRTGGYDLVEVPGGARRPLLRREGPPAGERVGAFVLLPEGKARAESVLRSAPPGAVLVVDEIGPLELEGKGFRAVLEEMLERPGTRVLAAVRAPLAARAASLADGPLAAVVHPLSDPDLLRKLTGLLFGPAGREPGGADVPPFPVPGAGGRGRVH